MRPSGMATAAWGSVARQPALAASRLAVRRAGQRDTRPSLRCRDSAAAQPEVVCVGEALFDFIADQKGLPREKVKSWTPHPGGAPANVACGVAKLGAKVLFVSALGSDERGDHLRKLLTECGVDVSGVQPRPEPTRDIYVVRDAKGDREFSGFGLDNNAYCDCHLEADKLPLDAIKGAKVLVTGTLGLAFPDTRKAMHAAVAAAKEGGCHVVVDVNWRPVFWADKEEARRHITDYLQQADVVKLSDSDLEWLYGMKLITALLNPCAIAEQLPAVTGVLVTAGEEGSAFCFRASNCSGRMAVACAQEASGFVPAFKVDVTDTTGAGDAFTAGFIKKVLDAPDLASLAGDTLALKKAMAFASACGAFTTTRPGAISAQPSLGEAQALFETSEKWYNFW